MRQVVDTRLARACLRDLGRVRVTCPFCRTPVDAITWRLLRSPINAAVRAEREDSDQ